MPQHSSKSENKPGESVLSIYLYVGPRDYLSHQAFVVGILLLSCLLGGGEAAVSF